jgi:4-hydroxy-2-oxoglutarate aldolase
MKLQGIFLPITVPFDHAGDLYAIKVQHNVFKWNLTGVSGYVVSGAESIYLSSEEKVRMWEWVARDAAPEKIRIASTGMPSVHETIELGCRAAGLGYAAVWLEHTDPLYIRSVADRSPVPVIAPHAAVDHPNVSKQKLATSAVNLAQSFAAGASAACVGIANAVPYSVISIWEAHRTREHEAALDWQQRMARAIELVETTYGVAGLKYAMELNGYYGGLPRLPLVGLTPQAKAEIEAAFEGLKG